MVTDIYKGRLYTRSQTYESLTSEQLPGTSCNGQKTAYCGVDT